jgi:hypothetical protein
MRCGNYGIIFFAKLKYISSIYRLTPFQTLFLIGQTTLLETKLAKVVVLGPWWLALSLKRGKMSQTNPPTKPSALSLSSHHFALISFSYSLWLPSLIAFAPSNTI